MGFFPPEGDGVRILSLDGGDARCISELIVLEEFIHRLKHDLKRPIRPCEYFHSITGVGAAGAIAIFLGVLGMTVTDARDAFAEICDHVLHGDECTDITRSHRLEYIVKQILKRLNIPEDSRLKGDLRLGEGCNVSICYASAVNMSACRMFRSYRSSRYSYNPTVIEAIRASWATPGLFTPVTLGAELMQETVVSAINGFNNPTLEAIKEAHDIFGGERRVSCLLSLGAGHPGIRPASSPGYMRKIAEDTEMTAREIQRRLGRLGIHFRFSVERGMEVDTTIVEETFGAIVAHTSIYLEEDYVTRRLDRCLKISGRTSNATLDTLVHAHIQRVQSSHALPSLSAYFVARQKPMKAIVAALRNPSGRGQPKAIVTGFSGCGKTQMALKYAYDHDDVYDHIFFIDASSAGNIQTGLLSRLRTVDPAFNLTTTEGMLDLLAHPRGNLTSNWLLIMDNAENIHFDIRTFFPACSHGAVLITSRNSALGNLSQSGHVSLDVMSTEEAVKALLSAALGSTTPTNERLDGVQAVAKSWDARDRQHAVAIVEELGCLPIAVIQAACYIKVQNCLGDYLGRLKRSRSQLLRWPASVQNDPLMYAHSAYAAFDTTMSVLSLRALQVLGILSFFHFTGFPRPLVPLAASVGFDYDPFDLAERTSIYQESITLLKDTFCVDGNWDEFEFDKILEELRQYSLVTLVPVNSVMTLRFHPLLHAWSRDRLSEQERSSLGAAGVRMLVCGTNYDDDYLWEYLIPHVQLLPLASDDLHVNDRAALALVLPEKGEQAGTLVNIYGKICFTVQELYGERDVHTVRAVLKLAGAYGARGDNDQKEDMERQLLDACRSTLGPTHLETAAVMSQLAVSCKTKLVGLSEATMLEEETLRLRREALGPFHRDIVQALCNLAHTRILGTEYREARCLMDEALEMIITLVGRAHVATIRVMEQSSSYYRLSGNSDKYMKLQEEATKLWRIVRGDRHVATVDAMAQLARTYQDQGQYTEAERIWKDVADSRKELLGTQHKDYLRAVWGLAQALYHQRRLIEAEALLVDLLVIWRETRDADIVKALRMLAHIAHREGRFAEAETYWRDLVAQYQDISLFDNVAGAKNLSAQHWLAKALLSQSQYVEAEELLRKVVKERKRLLPRHHYDTLEAVGDLARAIFKQGKVDDGEQLVLNEGYMAYQAYLRDTTKKFPLPDDFNLGHLPSGWSIRLDPNDTIRFFHITSKTFHSFDPRQEQLEPWWDIRVNPEDGRSYFFNQETQEFTWVDPRHQSQGPSAMDPKFGPMPLGWEVRMMADGSSYFVDHNTQNSTWDDPRKLVSQGLHGARHEVEHSPNQHGQEGLFQMFPSLERDVVDAVLQQYGGNPDMAAEALLSM